MCNQDPKAAILNPNSFMMPSSAKSLDPHNAPTLHLQNAAAKGCLGTPLKKCTCLNVPHAPSETKKNKSDSSRVFGLSQAAWCAIHMPIPLCAHTCKPANMNLCIYIYIYIYACVCVCVNISTYVCVHIYTYLYLFTSMYINVNICQYVVFENMWICVWVNICAFA